MLLLLLGGCFDEFCLRKEREGEKKMFSLLRVTFATRWKEEEEGGNKVSRGLKTSKETFESGRPNQHINKGGGEGVEGIR